ncbi:hypothetical protein DFS34DRAFT_379771 [Phlyctochytrium arcticum]|nr:hypothetical protein DFS34DRAFT_379771 [Phlyctochytrium arcticum]
MADPMEVWYRLCNEKGEELGDLSSIPITPEVRNVDKLRKEVKKECPRHLADYDPIDLKVYANEAALKADIDSNTTLKGLDSREKLKDLKDTEQNPLQIVVPDRVQATTSDSEGLESRLFERLLPKVVQELRKQEGEPLEHKKFSVG